jgi:hypothetical protein
MLLLAAVAGIVCMPDSQAAPRVDIERLGSSQTRLSWNSMSNISYSVQTVQNLVTGKWDTVDSVMASGSATEWDDFNEDALVRFYRLVQPAAQLLGFEPGNVTTNGGQTGYVLGLNFDDEVELYIDGVAIPGVSVLSSALIEFSLPALSPGPHEIQLIDSGTGQVLDTWSNAFAAVTCGVGADLYTATGTPSWSPGWNFDIHGPGNRAFQQIEIPSLRGVLRERRTHTPEVAAEGQFHCCRHSYGL